MLSLGRGLEGGNLITPVGDRRFVCEVRRGGLRSVPTSPKKDYFIPATDQYPMRNQIFSYWASLGVKLSPQLFERKVYAFDVKKAPQLPAYLSPFHKVTLVGNPDVQVPWSDPYLLMEWESFLLDSGFTRSVEEGSRTSLSTYTYRRKKVLQVFQRADDVAFRFFNKKGQVFHQTKVPKRERPDVKITQFGDPEPDDYEISIYGHPFKVKAYFEKGDSRQARENTLRAFGEILQTLPKGVVEPFIVGVGEEKPLQVVLASQEKARELKILSGSAGGNYNRGKNRVWINLEGGSIHVGTAFHEMGGHASADFFVSEKNNMGIVRSVVSALRDYYVWKVKEAFTPKELAVYMEMSRLIRAVDEASSSLKEDDEKILTKGLKPYRTHASKHFVSNYAVEGGYGIEKAMEESPEHFAEVMERFYLYAMGVDLNRSFHDFRARDQLLTLAGLHYLFYEYDVEKIGEVERKSVFSRRTFDEVLDLDIPQYPKEIKAPENVYNETLEWVKHRRGPNLRLRMGTGLSRLHLEETTGLSLNHSFGVGTGFQVGNLTWGGEVGYAYFHSPSSSTSFPKGHQMDTSLWFEEIYKYNSVSLSVAPRLGLRLLKTEEESSVVAPLMGVDLNIIFAGGGLRFFLGGDTAVGEDYNQLGVRGGMMLDLYHLFIRR